MASLVGFRYGSAGADPARTLFVDGTVDGYRSLSHWPGNTTPGPLKRDLSTQICLAWAEASSSEREALVGSFDEVANNHFDADGVLSAFSVLQPEISMAHHDLMVRTAATGDFSIWTGPDALALELTIMNVTSHPASPLAAELPADSSNATRWEAGYRWLLEQLPALLESPFALQSLWAERHERVCREIAAIDAGSGPRVERHAELDLALVSCAHDPTNIALHHAAGELYRVLLVQPGDDGQRYRFCYRDESWFETVDIQAAPRVALDDVVAELERREQAAAARHAPSSAARPAGVGWWAGTLTDPVVELRHGPGPSGDAFADDPLLSQDAASRLPPEEVFDVLSEALRGA
jgi:hypothetical protein